MAESAPPTSSTDSGVSVKVAVRCRPLVPKEVNEGCQMCVEFLSDEPQVLLGNHKRFTFDYTFGADAPQVDVFQMIEGLVENVFKGYNATVLAYGQTGSGKTYTMGTGITNIDEIDNNTGIVPRVAKMLFEMMEEKSNDTQFCVKVSFLEIYREDIVDLLSGNKDKLPVREDPDGGIMVAGLREDLVLTAEDTLFKLNSGSKARAVGATAMNAGSSRSHAIFTIIVEQRKKSEDGEEDYCRSKLQLVDLAGSERVSKTKAEGQRLKEGININRGLLSLGNVISALADDRNRRKDGHIPYRDSKLTRILQDSLGGNSHTLMIACVSPADSNMEETLSTLRYADRAKNIKNKPIVNRDARQLELVRLKQQNQHLRLQLAQLGGGGDVGGGGRDEEAEKRNKQLASDNHQLMKDLRTVMEQNLASHERLLSLDAEREEWKEEMEKIRDKADAMISNQDSTLDGHKEFVREVRESVVTLLHHGELVADTSETAAAGSTSMAGHEGEVTQLNWSETQYTKEQAARTRDIQRIEDNLARKLEEMKAVTKADGEIIGIVDQYKKEIETLQGDIEKLQVEKDSLAKKLGGGGRFGGGKVGNAGDDGRLKKIIEDKEQQLTGMRKKLVEQNKVLKLKEQNDTKMQQLRKEIVNMKQAKVKLVKQMKEESDKFRTFKRENEKRVNQLIAKDRKKQAEIVKLSRQNQVQEQKLKRKNEEAVAAQKRLKEALEKQRMVRDTNNSKILSGASGERIKKFLSQEIDIKVSTRECKQLLENMAEERKDLMKQRRLVEARLLEPPSKKAAITMCENESPIQSPSTDRRKLEDKLNQIKKDIDLKTAEIADLQQKILAADEADKNKHKWTNLSNLQEAKYAAAYLLDQVVESKVESFTQRQTVCDLREELKSKVEDVDLLGEQMEEVRGELDEKMSEERREWEEKVRFLLSQIRPHADKINMDISDASLNKKIKNQDRVLKLYHDHNQQLSDRLQGRERKGVAANIMKMKTPARSPGHKTRLSLFPAIDQVEEEKPLFAIPMGISTKTTAATNDNDAHGKKRKIVEMENIKEEDDDDDISDNENTLDGDDNDKEDPDWKKTPSLRRTRTLVKRNNSVETPQCVCNTDCSMKRCGCNKSGRYCSITCKCNKGKCRNTAGSLRPEVNAADSTTECSGKDIDLMDATFVCSASTSCEDEGGSNEKKCEEDGTLKVPQEKRRSYAVVPTLDALETKIPSPKKRLERKLDSPSLFGQTP